MPFGSKDTRVGVEDEGSLLFFDATSLNFLGDLVQAVDAGGGAVDITVIAPTAAQVSYDGAASGLSATDTQAAVDELDTRVDALEAAPDADTRVDILDEGAPVISNASGINFLGALITAADAGGGQADVTIVAPTAAQVSYDGAASGLSATDTQAAVDELDTRVDALEAAPDADTHVDVLEEGAPVVASAASLNFLGALVTAADAGAGQVDVTVVAPTSAQVTYDNAASGLTAVTAQAAVDELDGRVDALEAAPDADTHVSIHDEGALVQADAGLINFVGAGVTAATNGAGGATVTIPGASGLQLPTLATPARALNSNFQPSATRPVLCVYSVQINCDDNETGTVELRSDTVATPVTVRCSALSFINAFGVLSAQAESSTRHTLVHLVPAGHFVRLVTSGSASFSFIHASEITL